MEENEKLIGIDLSLASKEVIEILIDDFSEPTIFEEIARENLKRPEILEILLRHPELPQSVRDMIAEVMSMPTTAVDSQRAALSPEARRETLSQKIQKLSVSQRIQLALRGGREIRGILAKDPNKEVSLGVLENGKITETEVELIAKSRSTLEEALRRISKNREWMKKYAVIFAIVNNPKTPAGIAVTHVSDIKTKDLAILEKNKNVSEAVRIAAKRLLQSRKTK